MSTQYNRRLFFMHIPKTAGSFINELAVHNATLLQVHIETERNNDFSNLYVENLRYLSGHLRYQEIESCRHFRALKKAVLLREPYSQLTSHLNWVLRISEDVESELFWSKPKEIQNLSLFIRSVDFGSQEGLNQWVNDLSDFGKMIFNNCQTRYLSGRDCKIEYKKNDSVEAIQNLENIDFVGCVDSLDIFMERVCAYMDWEPLDLSIKVNGNLNPKPIFLDDVAREVLCPFVESDLRVYDFLKSNIYLGLYG